MSHSPACDISVPGSGVAIVSCNAHKHAKTLSYIIYSRQDSADDLYLQVLFAAISYYNIIIVCGLKLELKKKYYYDALSASITGPT